MKNQKLRITAFGILALCIMVLGSFKVANINVSPVSGSTAVNYNVESPHEYTNNMDEWYTIQQDGAGAIRLRLYVKVESNYDYLYLCDGSNNVITTYTGETAWHWTEWVTGDTVKLHLVTDVSITDYGFRTYKYEYNESTAPVDEGGTLTSGVGAAGSLSVTDVSDMWSIDVGANAESLRVVLDCPNVDFDTYGRLGAEPTTSTYDFRGYTGGGEDNTVTGPGAGTWYIMAQRYSGDGDYTLTATVTYAQADEIPPTVSITNPSNGVTVSGTVTISFTASDANGISSRAIKINGVTQSTSSSYSWDTTAYSDGSYSIQCTATDPSGNTGSATNTVTVSNAVTDEGGELTNGVAATGSISASDVSDMWYIDVGANAQSLQVVLECGSADFDTYGRFGAEPTTSTYDWRGYTSGGEDNTVTAPAQGTHYIMVQRYSGEGSYSLTATISIAADTTAPTVSISSPSDGATVSDTVTVSFTASDSNGISSRVIKIDGITVSTTSSYSWDTTTATDGSHTIQCTATDPSGNVGSDTHTVTVSNTPADDGGELNDGVAASGHMDSTDGADMWYIGVGANADSMQVVLDQASGDFDTYGRFNAEPTTTTYDWRGYTSGGEDNTITSPAQGKHYIMVDYYSGDDDYTLTVTITYAGLDTTAPTVAISAPSNGATVTGTVTISFTASDDNGISSQEIQVDGVTKSTGSSYSWDTTAESDGSHTIVCTATDPSGNTGSDTHTVTVDNSGSGGDNVLTDGVTSSSSLAAQGATEMWTITVPAGKASMYSVLTCGSSDYDLYGRLGAEPTTSTYDWRGYTSGGEEVSFSSPGAGTWYIMVHSYSGSGAYDLTVTLNDPVSTDWGDGGKYAILVGISDYASISDLNYCDEDATDWYNYLVSKGYEVHIYGDTHSANYPIYHGDATEANVRAAMQELAAHAQSGDKVYFATSGHGDGDGSGSSYLCMYDCSGSAGCYYDTELAADINLFASGVQIGVFIDHCYSGGMGPELMALSNSQYIYCTTTCTEDGYGYDEPSHLNGAWTYEYLEKYLVSNPSWTMEYTYDQASASYPHTGGDACMEFDGDSGTDFYF
jgi:hypothetical protein